MAEPASDPKRHSFDNTEIFLEKIAVAPQSVKETTLTILRDLERFPFPGTSLLGVVEYEEDDLDNAYTVGRDGILMLFQVLSAKAVILLIDVMWIDVGEGTDSGSVAAI